MPWSTREPVTVQRPRCAALAAPARQHGPHLAASARKSRTAGLTAGGTSRPEGVGRRVKERLQLTGALPVAGRRLILGRIVPGASHVQISPDAFTCSFKHEDSRTVSCTKLLSKEQLRG